jgi:hypothetical protein
MGLLAFVAEIIKYLLIFVGVTSIVFIVLVVAVSRMSGDNPLKRLLVALCYRVGATLAAGALAIPVEPLPGIDAIYDIGVPILLVVYWLSFFRNVHRLMTQPVVNPPAGRAGAKR